MHMDVLDLRAFYYRTRLGRVLLFRTCIYALLTLIAAMAARGGSGAA